MKTILVKLSNLVVLFALFVLPACQDEDVVKQTVFGMAEKEIPLSFELAGIVTVGDDSRAILPLTEDERKIHSGVLLQFGKDGSMLKKYDLTAEQITDPNCKVRLYVPQEGQLMCVFIANATLTEMGLNGDKTITQEDLNTVARKINSYDDLQVNENRGLLMSGKSDIDANITSLQFELKPNVAKLDFSVKTTGTDGTNHIYKIYSIQVKNVHNTILFALHAADKADEYKVTDATSRMDYERIAFSTPLEPNKEAGVLPTVYIAHNMAGAYVNKADTKVGTYVEVEGDRTIDRKRVVFKIPLNPDAKSYNVKGGHYYNLAINLSTDGENTDFVPFPKSIDYDSSNCYLINPYTSGIGTMFSFPIDKINDYWQELANPKEGFTEDTEWKAEVIWQDMPAQIVQFYNTEEPTDFFVGKGTQQRVYFKFTDQVGNASFNDVRNHGNIVIGIRKKLEDGTYEKKYRWSWHLWITNYNPNSAKTPHPNWQTTYPNHVWNVDGGEVHRYSDPLKTTGGVWAVDYKDSYIMDRSIGGIGNHREAGNRFQVGGLFYQYGRKDPFPAYVPLYNIKGTRITSFLEGTHNIKDNMGTDRPLGIVTLPKVETNYKESLENAIFYPYAFYPCSSGQGGDWLCENPYYITNWNYPADDRDMGHKSLFDPCPLGWKVVRGGAWLIFSNNFEGENFNNAFQRTTEYPDGRYYLVHNEGVESLNVVNPTNSAGFSSGDNIGWYFYIADRGKGPTAYYAANGYRADYDGAINTTDITAWSIDSGLGTGSEGDHPTWAYHLDAYSTRMDLPDIASRSYALPVRCVRETEE